MRGHRGWTGEPNIDGLEVGVIIPTKDTARWQWRPAARTMATDPRLPDSDGEALRKLPGDAPP